MIRIDMQMPERCGVCFAMHTDEIGLESWCGIDETARDIYTEEINTKRPDWCPLKEQEAKQVTIAQAHCGMKYGLCPRCGKQIDTLVNPGFCGYCGQAVKWE